MRSPAGKNGMSHPNTPEPDFSAFDLPPVPPMHAPENLTKKERRTQIDTEALARRHGIDRVAEPQPVEQFDDVPEEELVSFDDPIAVESDKIGLNVVLEGLNGIIIEETTTEEA